MLVPFTDRARSNKITNKGKIQRNKICIRLVNSEINAGVDRLAHFTIDNP